MRSGPAILQAGGVAGPFRKFFSGKTTNKNFMETLILSTLGLITGSFVSRSSYKKRWDVTIGILGALAVGLLLSNGARHNPFSFFVIMAGSLLIIYVGRSLQNFSHN